MSNKVDSRVVQMRFDNKDFERNVRQTIASVKELEKSLNMRDAGKGLRQLNSAAQRVNLNGLKNAAEAVTVKFDAMSIVSMRAISNITDMAMNAGMKIAKHLTVEPVFTGYQEYELKMDSMKTITASTGESVKTVSKYLDELNQYADDTIYKFSDMTNNIGKFTNAGVNLRDSVTAMKGIANEAALSGANTEQASRAMYNFSQALSMGYVAYIDWRSIELAHMATVDFKKQLLETATRLKTVKKTATGLYDTGGQELKMQQMFKEGLKDKWLTNKVLIETLKKYGDEQTAVGEKAYKAAKSVTKFTQMVDVAHETAQSGWAKTFEILFGDLDHATRLWTAVSEFVNNIIDRVSDFRNKLLGDAFAKSIVDGFKTVKGVQEDLAKTLEDVLKPLREGKKAFEDMTKPIKETSKSLKEYEQLARRIRRGDYNNAPARRKIVSKDGYDPFLAQNIVNRQMSDPTRQKTMSVVKNGRVYTKLTKEYSEAAQTAETSYETLKKAYDKSQTLAYRDKQNMLKMDKDDLKRHEISDKRLAQIKKEIEENEKLVKAYHERRQHVEKEFKILTELSKEQLKNLGYTDEQIKAIKALGETSKKTGIPLLELIDNIKELNGKFLFLRSFKNIGQTIVAIFKAIGKAWNDVFPAASVENVSDLIMRFHKLTEVIKQHVLKNADNLYRTFRGVFSIFGLVYDVATAVTKVLWSVVKGILSIFNLDLFQFSAMISDWIFKIRQFIKEHKLFFELFHLIGQTIGYIIKKAIEGWKILYEYLKGLGIIDDIRFKLLYFFETIKTGLQRFKKGIESAENIGQYLVEGLIKGITAYAPKIWDIIKSLGNGLVEAIKKVLGIHSPSTVFFEIGKNIVDGLVNGIMYGLRNIATVFGGVIDTIREVGTNLISSSMSMIHLLPLNKIMTGLIAFGAYKTFKNITDMLQTFAEAAISITAPLRGLGSLLKNLGKSLKIKAKASKISAQSKMIKSIALSLLVLAIAIKIIAGIDEEGLLRASIVISVFLLALLGIVAALSKLAGAKGSIKTTLLAGIILSIGVAIWSLSRAIKILSIVTVGDILKASAVMAALAIFMKFLVTFLSGVKINKNSAATIKQWNKLLRSIAISLLLMVLFIKLAGRITPAEIGKAITVMVMLGTFMLALKTFSQIKYRKYSQYKGLGKDLIQMSVALLLMIAVIKLAGKLKPEEIITATAVLALLGLFYYAMIRISNLLEKEVQSVGGSLLLIAAAMLILAGTIALIGMLKKETIIKGLVVIGYLSLFVAGLIAVTSLAGKNAFKASAGILMIAGAIMALTLAIGLIGFMDPQTIMKGLIVIGFLSLFIAGLIAVTSIAGKISKTATIQILTLIGVLTALVIIMSLIKDIDKQAMSIAAAGGAILAMVATLKILEKIKIRKGTGKRVAKTFLALGAILLMMVGFSWLLGTIDPKPVSTTAVLQTVALFEAATLVLAGLLAMTKYLNTSKTGKTLSKNQIGMLFILIGALALLAPVIALFGWALRTMSGIEVSSSTVSAVVSVLSAAAIISGAFMALGAVISNLGVAGLGITAGVVLVGLLGMVGLAGVLALFIHVIKGLNDIDNAEAKMESVSNFMLTMAKVLSIIAMVSPLLLITVAALTGLLAVVTAFSSIVSAIGLFMLIPGFDKVLDKGIEAMIKLSTGLGKMMAAFINSLLSDAVLKTVIKTGIALSLFGEKVVPFFKAISKSVDDETLKKVSILSNAILKLTTSAFIASVTSFGDIQETFVDMGEGLAKFGEKIQPFFNVMKEVDPKVLVGVRYLSESLLILSTSKLIDSISRAIPFFSKKASTESFYEGIGNLGTGVREFMDNVGVLDDQQLKTAEIAAKVVKTLSETFTNIPRESSIGDTLFGERDIGGFSENLVKIAKGLKKFMSVFGEGISAKQQGTVRTAASLLQTIITTAKDIPDTGGLKALILGDNDIKEFADKIPSVRRINTKIYKHCKTTSKCRNSRNCSKINRSSCISYKWNDRPC